MRPARYISLLSKTSASLESPVGCRGSHMQAWLAGLAYPLQYVRQPRNLGAAPNHNYVVQQARGELNGEALGSRDSRRHERGDDEPIVGGEERVLPTHRYHITTGVGPGQAYRGCRCVGPVETKL